MDKFKIETFSKIKIFKKGAIIVGRNSEGKTSILERIKKESNWTIEKPGKIKINDENHKVYFWSADKNLYTLNLKNKIAKMKLKIQKKKSQLEKTLHDSQPFQEYKEGINHFVRSTNQKNIFKTGIDLSFESDIITNFEIKGQIKLNGEIIESFTENDINSNKISSGIKSIISFILSNINKNIKNGLFLIDEIDAHLHPKWIHLISELLFKLWENNNKILIITHNPFLLSKLAKVHYNLISFVQKHKTQPSRGNLKLPNWKNINRKLLAEFKKRETFFTNKKKSRFNAEFVDLFISSSINLETSKIFFDDSPLFVEGYTDKIFLERVFNEDTIQCGGYFQFPLFHFIANEFDWIKPRFIMDHDNKEQKDTYNQHVFEILSANEKNRVFRMEDDLEKLLFSKNNYSKRKLDNLIIGMQKQSFKKDNPKFKKLLDFLNQKM